ncbi:MAG: DNA-binding response regulator [Dyadobacter sp. 50-39]|uniref:response regulator transcription factor n=1 Tax=Dyadobacter sp. 50-39 TaxID=1895756 RepID=UPI00095CD580|nr:response regulator transcription factor [Dyadobacter sp. 50-39]OJV15521.1 MAG: DNA-binding response regulator [Dyadobacter sp. 50-39]
MNIVLVDEHLLLADALQSLLQLVPEINRVDTYTDGRDFLTARSACPPDILVMDLALNGPNGFELLDICRATLPRETKVIVLSAITDPQTVKHTIRRGANSFLSKSTLFEEFKESIFQVQSGKQYIGKAIRDSLINSVFTEEEVVMHLSPREKEVLQKVCGGHTIKEIAYELRLSAHTVQYYHRSVMDKLKVRRTTDLIVYAMQHGLYIPEAR